jgi:hypothetical protein
MPGVAPGLYHEIVAGSEAAWVRFWCFQCHQLRAVPGVQWRMVKRLGSRVYRPGYPACFALVRLLQFVLLSTSRSGGVPEVTGRHC